MKIFTLVLFLGFILNTAMASMPEFSSDVESLPERSDDKAPDRAAYLELVRSTIDLMGPAEEEQEQTQTAETVTASAP